MTIQWIKRVERMGRLMLSAFLIAALLLIETPMFIVKEAHAASAGPRSPTNSVGDSSGGFNAWGELPATGLNASDNVYVRDDGAFAGNYYYVKSTGFGFSLPANATINGIVVEWEKQATDVTGGDHWVRIVKNGTIGSTDKANPATWPATDTYVSYGGSTDLWGTTWTASDINAANFGAALSATRATGDDYIRLDHVRITVYYTSAPTATTLAATSITGTSATLNGTANPQGQSTTGWFRYSSTNPGSCNDTFGTRAPSSGGDALGSGTSVVAFNEPITGLTNGTTYYYCAIAQNATGTSFGSINSFLATATPVSDGQYTAIAFDSFGFAWMSYYDATNTSLKVGRYVGSGGSGCQTSAWICTTVDNDIGGATTTGQYTAIAFEASGNPWVSYYDATNTSLKVANYVTSGGNCTSTAWNCTTVDNAASVGEETSITLDADGKARVSYYDLTNTALKVASYVTSGGDCTSTAWNCTAMDNDIGGATTTGSFSGIGLNPFDIIRVFLVSDTTKAHTIKIGSQGGIIIE